MSNAKHIEYWDDERSIGNGVLVTLAYGWSFEPREHAGVRGFDTITEARRESAKKSIYPCACDICRAAIAKARGE